MYPTLLFLHLAAAIIWVGGMFFAYYCLRPAAGQTLEPPLRLPLWVATFKPFFRYVAVAVVLIVGSGFGMMLPVGMGASPLGWLLMMVLGLVMAAVFVYVYWILYPGLVRHTEAAAWPAAAATLNSIRRLVALNLLLSVVVVMAAVSAR
ncbi:MAG: CopD family protein [Gammaproteobacteria bacterium]